MELTHCRYNTSRWRLLACSLALIANAFGPLTSLVAESDVYGDPSRFEDQILEFEQSDKVSMPDAGQALFVGSSSIRGWHAHLAEDMAPLPIIARGFGGSNMHDLNHFADRIVFPYQPKTIVVYEGDNDIASGVTVERFLVEFQVFLERVKRELPDTQVYFLSIKPSVKRWKLWPQMKEANDRVKILSESEPALEFVDVATVLLNEKGEPDEAFFVEDMLHMNREGYQEWRAVVRQALLLDD